jgi:hypothetical protein
VEVEVEVGVD